MKENIIYFDNNATTPLDERVLSSMMPYFTEFYGNSSSMHMLGRKSQIAVDRARIQVGDLINSNPEDVFFTAGATEAINLALRGVVTTSGSKSPNIITVSTEHPAVLDTCTFLESTGVEITYLSVDRNGLIDLSELESALNDDTILVSVMWANNETGVIQPIRHIAELAHRYGSLFMSDATQAIGRTVVDVLDEGVDLLAFSGHKFYGPKGIGGLYVNPGLKLGPIIFGGGQERGLRSGTLNIPGIVGIGSAAMYAVQDFETDSDRIGRLAKKLASGLLDIDSTWINGDIEQRLYNTINVCFSGLDNDALLLNLRNICVSNGSACHSMTMEPSHVLRAMGLSNEESNSSLRFSLGRFNTDREIDQALLAVMKAISELRALAGN